MVKLPDLSLKAKVKYAWVEEPTHKITISKPRVHNRVKIDKMVIHRQSVCTYIHDPVKIKSCNSKIT
jgi:hypothetical protein